MSPSTISELNQKVYQQIEVWRNRKLESDYRNVFSKVPRQKMRAVAAMLKARGHKRPNEG